MKSIQEKILENQINECNLITKESKNIYVYVQIIQPKKEYYLNITISKNIFKHEEILTNNYVPLDIHFILHLTSNFPINPPKLYCLTSLSAININICDAKDILYIVLSNSEWNNKITAKEIILKIPEFLNFTYEKNRGIFFWGQYYLNKEYDYKILDKIPNTYFNEVEQILNEKNNYTEKRLLMITDLFFLIFSFDYSIISSYSNVRLVFWASIKSIFGMKNTDVNFQFEFSKTDKQRIFIYLNTIEGAKIMDTVLENLRKMGIDYSVNKGKTTDNNNDNKMNNVKDESKLLPKYEVLDKAENENKNNEQKDK